MVVKSFVFTPSKVAITLKAYWAKSMSHWAKSKCRHLHVLCSLHPPFDYAQDDQEHSAQDDQDHYAQDDEEHYAQKYESDLDDDNNANQKY